MLNTLVLNLMFAVLYIIYIYIHVQDGSILVINGVITLLITGRGPLCTSICVYIYIFYCTYVHPFQQRQIPHRTLQLMTLDWPALDPQGLGWLNASAGDRLDQLGICHPKPIQSMYGIFTYI